MSNQYQIQAPNYTQTPNVIFEYWMPLLSGSEFKVLCCLARKIFGWHKSDFRDQISLTQIEEMTGLSRQSVTQATKSLEDHKLIRKYVTGEIGTQQTVYEIIVDPEPESNNYYQSKNLTPPQSKNLTPPSLKIRHTKETSTKENILKESSSNTYTLRDPPPLPKPSIPKPLACAATASEKIFFKDPRGNATSIDESIVYRKMLDSGFPTEVISESIAVLRNTEEPVGNAFKFIESICLRIVNQPKKSKRFLNSDKMIKTPCQFNPSSNKVMTMAEFLAKKERENGQQRQNHRA